jgi:hypothetical protein
VNSKFRYAAIGLWFASTLIHPQTSLYLFLFYSIAAVNKGTLRDISAIFLTSIVIPMTLMILLFPSKHHLSSSEFVRLYAFEGLPWHYLPSHFATLGPFPWWISYILINCMIIAPLLYGVIWKKANIAVISILFLTVYVSSILLQYMFVELIPIRMVAILGPSRMSFLGYWMVVVLYTLCAIELFFSAVHEKTINRIPHFTRKMNIVYPILVIFILAASVSIFFKDDPYKRVSSMRTELYKWIGGRTDKDSVFVTYPDGFLGFSIPLIAKRAIFFGNGFPVNEEFLEEYIKRKQMIYGSLSEQDKLRGYWPNGRFNSHYQSLMPADFINISRTYQLDYVLVDKSHSGNFMNIKPVFTDETTNVYSIGGMIEACEKTAGSKSDR